MKNFKLTFRSLIACGMLLAIPAAASLASAQSSPESEIQALQTARSTVLTENSATLGAGQTLNNMVQPGSVNKVNVIFVGRFRDGSTGSITLDLNGSKYNCPVDGSARVVARNVSSGGVIWYTFENVPSTVDFTYQIYIP